MLALTSKAIMAASVTILKRSEQPQNAIMWPNLIPVLLFFSYHISMKLSFCTSLEVRGNLRPGGGGLRPPQVPM